MTNLPDYKQNLPPTPEAWQDFVAQRHKTEAALLERIKELNCLYGITRLAQQTDQPLNILLTAVASLIRSSWQYPDVD